MSKAKPLPPMARQCVSCPFRQDNPEFEEFMRANASKADQWRITDRLVADHREQCRLDTIHHKGQFACHRTVFTGVGEVLPKKHWKQCRGATKFIEQSNKDWSCA